MYRSRRSRTDNRRGDAPGDAPGASDRPVAGTITALQTQRRDPERMNVSLDGTFAFGLHADLVLEHGLAVGTELDAARVSELIAQDEIARSTAAALQFLAYRPRSEGEIRRRLRERGFTESAVDATIARLRDWRYVDDADFSSRWIENRVEHRPRSARLLGQELRQKGVDPGVIAGAIEEADIDEQRDALAMILGRIERYRALEPDVRSRRISGLLSRRGYGWDIIREVLAELERILADDQDSGAESPGS